MAVIKRAGRIPRQQRGDGYYAIHPVYGTVQQAWDLLKDSDGSATDATVPHTNGEPSPPKPKPGPSPDPKP